MVQGAISTVLKGYKAIMRTFPIGLIRVVPVQMLTSSSTTGEDKMVITIRVTTLIMMMFL